MRTERQWYKRDTAPGKKRIGHEPRMMEVVDKESGVRKAKISCGLERKD